MFSRRQRSSRTYSLTPSSYTPAAPFGPPQVNPTALAAAASVAQNRCNSISSDLSSAAAAAAIRRHSFTADSQDALKKLNAPSHAPQNPGYRMGASRSPSRRRSASTQRQNTQRSHSARPQSHINPKPTAAHTPTSPAYNQPNMTRTMSLQGGSRAPSQYPPPTTTTSKCVVNPDRTLSLTRTTVRTYGSFQLISTKTTHINAPPPKKKPASKKKPLKKPQAPVYASSMQSIESDLDSVLEEDDSYYNDDLPGMPPAIYISDDNTSSTLASRPKSVSTPTKQHRISFSPVPSDEGHHQPPPRSVSPIKPALKADPHHSHNASVSSKLDEPTNSVYLAPNSNGARRQSRVSFSSSDAVNEYNAHHPPSAPPASKYSYEIIVPPSGGPSIVSSTTLTKKTPAASAAAVSAASKSPSKTVNKASQSTRRHSVQAAAAAATKAPTSKTNSPVISATPAPPPATRVRAPAARSKALAQKVYDDDDEDSSSGHSIYSDASDYPLSELSPPQIPSPKQPQQSPTKPVTVAAANYASQKHQPKPRVSGPNVEAAAAARSSSIRNSNGMAVPPSPIPATTASAPTQQQQQGGPGLNGVARRTSLRKNSKPVAQSFPVPTHIPAAASAASAAAIVLPSPSVSHSYRALVNDNDEPSYAAAVMPITDSAVATPGISTTTTGTAPATTPSVRSLHKLHGKYDHEEGVYDPYIDENQPEEHSDYSEDENAAEETDMDDVISMNSDSSWIRDRSGPVRSHLTFRDTLRSNNVRDVDDLGVIRENPASPVSAIAPPKKRASGNQQQKTWKRVNPPSYNPQFFESTRHKPQSEYVGLERTLSNSSFDKERQKKKASSKFAFHSLRDARDRSMPPQQQASLLPPPQLNGRSMSLTATISRSSFAAADGPPLAQPFKSRLKDDSDSDYEGVITDTLKNVKVSKPRRSSFGAGSRAAGLLSSSTPAPVPASPPAVSPPSPQKHHGFLSTLRKDASHFPHHSPPAVHQDLQTQLTPPSSFLPATKSRSPSSPSALADVPEEDVIPGTRKHTKLGALFAKRQHIVDMQNQRYHERKTNRSHSMTSGSTRPVFGEAPPIPEHVISDPIVAAPTLRNHVSPKNAAHVDLVAPPVPQTPAENGSAVPTTPKKKKFSGLRKAFGLDK